MKKNPRYGLLLVFLLLTLTALSQKDPIEKAWKDYHSNPIGSKQKLNRELVLSRQHKDIRKEAKCLSYLGAIHDIEGDSKKAIELLLQAIRIQERKNFQEDLSFSYNNLGVAHFYQDNYDIALNYYQKSYHIDSLLNNQSGAAGTLVNIGLILTYQNKSEQAQKNYLLALESYKALKDSNGICSVYSNLGKIYFEKKAYQKAIEYYQKCIANLPKNAGIEVSFTPYYGLANSHIQLKRYPEAIQFAHIAIQMAEKVQAKERLQYGYEILAEAEGKAQNFESAYEFMRKYTQIRDAIVNQENGDAIAEMEAKFQDEQRDKELLEAKSKRLEDEKNLAVFKFTLTISLSIILVLIITIALFWQRNKANKQKSELLKLRNDAIQENLQQKEMMIGEIHHRVKNNLQLISSIIDLHARTLGEGKERNILLDSRKRVESIAIVHQKLYQSDEIFSIELTEYFNDLGYTMLHHFPTASNPTSLLVKSLDSMHVHIDTAIPLGLILSELITNSLKYAFEKVEYPLISIELVRNRRSLLLIYKDNGQSFDPVTWETGTSFGKRMIGSLLRQLKADASFSEQDGGFTAQLNCSNIIWKEK